MGEFMDLVEAGAIEMSEVERTVDALARLGLGAADWHDDFTRRVSEVIPDPAIAMRTLSVLPGVLEGVNALIPIEDPRRQCSNGLLPLPITADVLLHGRQLVVCDGGACCACPPGCPRSTSAPRTPIRLLRPVGPRPVSACSG